MDTDFDNERGQTMSWDDVDKIVYVPIEGEYWPEIRYKGETIGEFDTFKGGEYSPTIYKATFEKDEYGKACYTPPKKQGFYLTLYADSRKALEKLIEAHQDVILRVLYLR